MAQTGSQAGGASAPSAASKQDNPPAASATADAERVAELERENKALREQLAEAGRPAPVRQQTPSFTFSASMAAELETTGRTVSPFDGKRYVGTSADDAKEATVEEFNNAKPPARDAEKSDRKPAAGRKR